MNCFCMFVFLGERTAYSCITGLVISMGRSQCNVIFTHIKITSSELYQPKSAMPRWPSEVVLRKEVTCEQRSTLEPIVTYVAAVHWVTTSTVTLIYQQHKATCYYDVH
jgi:hypothetical protein